MKVVEMINKIVKGFDKAVTVLCDIFLIVLIVCVGVQVFVRFVLARFMNGISVPWTETLSIYCYAWLTLFGSVMVFNDGGLMYVDVIQNLLKGTTKTVVSIVCDLISMVVAAFWCYSGVLQCINAVGITGWGLEIPLSLVYSSVPISFACLFFFMLLDIVKKFILMFKGGEGR